MKTFLVILTILCTMVGVAKPTISYAPTHYVHDSSKISGLLSAGSLLAMQEPVLIGKNLLECASIVHKVLSGKVGETVKCPIVIDDADGIEQIEGFSFSVKSAFKPKNLSVSFTQDAPIKKGQRSLLKLSKKRRNVRCVKAQAWCERSKMRGKQEKVWERKG